MDEGPPHGWPFCLVPGLRPHARHCAMPVNEIDSHLESFGAIAPTLAPQSCPLPAMNRVASRSLLLFLLSWLLWPAMAAFAANTPDNDIGPTIVHLLDYVGVDYPATVRDGKVLDASEYQEQVE